MAAIGRPPNTDRHQIGEALENMGKVDTIAFDKTDILHSESCKSMTLYLPNQIWKRIHFTLVASAEARSEHPLGKAIVAR